MHIRRISKQRRPASAQQVLVYFEIIVQLLQLLQGLENVLGFNISAILGKDE